jgi:16S rRNA (uracil1498-N3)-methyltransferase
MRRFYFAPENRQGDEVALSVEQVRHAVRVLRLKNGARLELLDGLGTVYSAELRVAGERVTARIDGVITRAGDTASTLWVAQGILRGDKMDHVVQKCTELGVTRFSPLESQRCQGRLSAEQGRKKLARWQRIGLEACKQSLRPLPMEIYPPTSLADFLSDPQTINGEPLRLVLWEEEKERHLRHVGGLVAGGKVLLLLGPEGGLSRDEITAARHSGFQTASLGERILRAETATLAAVAIVQYLTGGL